MKVKVFVTALIVILCSGISSVSGQVLKVHAGTTMSSLDWNAKHTIHNFDRNLFNDTINHIFLFAGVEFYQGRFINISSNIGLVKKGGVDEYQETTFDDSTPRTIQNRAELNYLVINSTADFFYRITPALYPFVSIGPRADIMLSYNTMFDGLNQNNSLNSINYGLILGLGVNYDIAQFQFGLRAEHYLNFTDIASWSLEEGTVTGRVRDQLFTLGFTLGYRI